MSRTPLTCIECGYPDDVEIVAGEPLCGECRRCPHGTVYHGSPYEPTPSDHFCLVCLRNLFTLGTFDGPQIFDVSLYYQYSVKLVIRPWVLLVWRVCEEDFLDRLAGYSGFDEQRLNEPFNDLPPHLRIKRRLFPWSV